jgi:peptide-methionine (S)-S-oxide reductase
MKCFIPCFFFTVTVGVVLRATSAFAPPNKTNRRCHHPPHYGSQDSMTARHAEQQATFGMGCFWEPSESLLQVKGVTTTIVGYTGNPTATKAPTYDSVCFGRDWVEGVRVIYDDDGLSYRELLDAVWKAQKPKIGSRQYASIIFAHSNEQETVAREWMTAQKETIKNSGSGSSSSSSSSSMLFHMAIEPQSAFYQAEGYHQNYWQKQRPRFAVVFGLLAISSGLLDFITPNDIQGTIRTVANAVALVLLLLQLVERQIDTKVVQL